MSSQKSNELRFYSLGGSNEVGRSCHILEYKGKTVMLDAGIHPAHQGLAALPFYDEVDLSKVDVLLVSHFHLDHAASLPYVMQRTAFRGRVFMTHPTKAIYRWLLRDFVRVTSVGAPGGSSSDENLYTDEDLASSFDRIETIDYHSEVEVNGIRFTAYHAGHVLGAAMLQVEIAGLRVLFTGDYSRELDRHLNSAEVPPLPSDVLIVESTFGTATHEPRLNREKRLTQLIHSTILRGGRVLMPVFALGRAQELMLILDEYWSQHTDDLGGGQVPIYYGSNLAKKCMGVFQTYVNMMNDGIRKKFRDSQTNPFIFKNIKYLKSLDNFQDFGPSVMLAAPGMLQNGLSRDLLERWCPDEKNLVLITGYSVEGTMAKYLVLEPNAIPSIGNPEANIPRRCQVEEISFAAHVDFQENLEFIEKINAPNIILVHGESNPMGRLKSAILSNFSHLKGTENEVHVYNPKNCVFVDLEFKGVKIAKAVGNIVSDLQKEESTNKVKKEDDIEVKMEEDSLVKDEDNPNPNSGEKTMMFKTEEKTGTKLEEEINDNSDVKNVVNVGGDVVVSGILVQDEKNFDLSLVSLADLPEHHPELKTTVLKEKQILKIDCKKELVYWHILQMFEEVTVVVDEDNVTNTIKEEHNGGTGKLVLTVMGNIRITIHNEVAILEWTQGLISDTVADSIMAILMSVDSSPASVKLSSRSCNHGHHSEVDKIKKIAAIFKEQFGDSFTLLVDKVDNADEDKDIKALITIGKNSATINLTQMKIEECNSNPLKGRVESIMNIGINVVASLC